ncbi:MAG: DUF484 family protein [Mangrovicoccus sp.]|nr:DUF484 family protein [Mangrovicoccus sp.]
MTTHSSAQEASSALRQSILSDPNLILDDPEVMEALASAQTNAQGGNVVDMRGMAMARLASRLDRLEETHQTVIAAAYDNVAVTRQVHRALMMLIAPLEFGDFLAGLNCEVSDCLRAKSIRLVIESAEGAALDLPDSPGAETITVVSEGYTARYRSGGRKAIPQKVILRQLHHGVEEIYGLDAAAIRSEAVLALDLGPTRLPGMLVIGSAQADQYQPGDATDLLEVFGAVFERLLRSWL